MSKKILEVAEYKRYRARLLTAGEAFRWGGKIRCAHDLRVAPARISDLLSGQYINEPLLVRVEGWIVEEKARQAKEAA